MKDWEIFLIIILVLLALSAKGGTTNLETWEWTDYRGHTYCINVHREVH
jgi:hypothetical protein